MDESIKGIVLVFHKYLTLKEGKHAQRERVKGRGHHRIQETGYPTTDDKIGLELI